MKVSSPSRAISKSKKTNGCNDSWGGSQFDLGFINEGWTTRRMLSKLVALEIDADLNVP